MQNEYRMATITGSYNVLLGANAALPNNGDSHQFVAGGPSCTSYLAYASVSGMVTAAGVRVQSSMFEIMGGTALSVGSTGAGSAGEALYSEGPGVPPAWRAAPVAAVRFSNSQAPALANVYTATVASLTLTLPAPANGATTIVKNMSEGPLTVAATIVPVSTTAVVGSITIGSGGAAGLLADGTTWYQKW